MLGIPCTRVRSTRRYNENNFVSRYNHENNVVTTANFFRSDNWCAFSINGNGKCIWLIEQEGSGKGYIYAPSLYVQRPLSTKCKLNKFYPTLTLWLSLFVCVWCVVCCVCVFGTQKVSFIKWHNQYAFVTPHFSFSALQIFFFLCHFALVQEPQSVFVCRFHVPFIVCVLYLFSIFPHAIWSPYIKHHTHTTHTQTHTRYAYQTYIFYIIIRAYQRASS